MVIRSYKMRFYPNKTQEKRLIKNLGDCRFVYNEILAYFEKTYKNEIENCKPFKITLSDLNSLLMKYKESYPFLNESESTSLRNSYIRLKNAFQRYFNKKLPNKRPKMKLKRNDVKSFTMSNINNNIRFTKGGKLKIPKMNPFIVHDKRKINGKIKQAHIIYEHYQWHVILVVETKIMPYEYTDQETGIDLGLYNIISLDNGEMRTKLQVNEEKRNKARKDLSRKTPGSKNYNKQLKKLNKIEHKIINQINDYMHKITHFLVKKYDLIAVENLNIRGMMKNKYLSHSIWRANWGNLIKQLKYKCESHNRIFIKVPRNFPSTKLCNVCGYKNEKLNLSIRDYFCPNCGTHLNRDINAAKNILQKAKKILSNKIREYFYNNMNRWCDGDSLVNLYSIEYIA